MPINMNQPKSTAKPKQKATEELLTPVIDPEVDELATLIAWAEKQAKSAKMTRLNELKKKFAEASMQEDYDEDEPVVFSGNKHRLEFGKKSNVRTLKDGALEKFANEVGEEAFLEVATIKIGDIDQYIAKKDQADYLDYDRGSRSMKVVNIE